MHAAADPLNVDRAVLKLQQLCVVNVLIDRQCSSQRKLCSVDVFKQLRHWTRQMKKYLLFCVRHFPEVLCDATKGTAVFQVGDYTPPTDNQFWSSDKASLSATTFLLSCYNITVNPEIEIRSYLKSFFRSFTKCVCFTGVISFHVRKRLKVTFFHLTSKQARLATGSCCISAHRKKITLCSSALKKNPPQNKTGSHLKKQAVKDVFRKQRTVRWRCPLAHCRILFHVVMCTTPTGFLLCSQAFKNSGLWFVLLSSTLNCPRMNKKINKSAYQYYILSFEIHRCF